MRAACGRLRDHGMEDVRGPISPTLDYKGGFLLEGYGDHSNAHMVYNPPYYHRLIEGEGFVKDRDLCAWRMQDASEQKPGEGLPLLGGFAGLLEADAVIGALVNASKPLQTLNRIVGPG